MGTQEVGATETERTFTEWAGEEKCVVGQVEEKQLKRQTLMFGVDNGGWQKPAEANDPCLRRVKSAAWFG